MAASEIAGEVTEADGKIPTAEHGPPPIGLEPALQGPLMALKETLVEGHASTTPTSAEVVSEEIGDVAAVVEIINNAVDPAADQSKAHVTVAELYMNMSASQAKAQPDNVSLAGPNVADDQVLATPEEQAEHTELLRRHAQVSNEHWRLTKLNAFLVDQKRALWATLPKDWQRMSPESWPMPPPGEGASWTPLVGLQPPPPPWAPTTGVYRNGSYSSALAAAKGAGKGGPPPRSVDDSENSAGLTVEQAVGVPNECVQAALPQPRMTVEMRNIPLRYSRVELISLFQGRGFKGSYNLVQLLAERGRSDGAACWRAFVNFNTVESAERFVRNFQGFTGWLSSADREAGNAQPCDVIWSDASHFWAALAAASTPIGSVS